MHIRVCVVLTPRIGKASPRPNINKVPSWASQGSSEIIQPSSKLGYTSPNQRQIVVDLKTQQKS